MPLPIDNWRRALHGFTVARFTDAELRVLAGIDLPELEPKLPGPGVSLHQLAFELISAAIRHGSVGELLTAMERELPQQARELREIRGLWIAAQASSLPRINRARSVAARMWIGGVVVALALQAFKPLVAAPSLRIVADVASTLALLLMLAFPVILGRVDVGVLPRARKAILLAFAAAIGACGFSLVQRRTIEVETIHLKPADDLFVRERGTPLNDTDTNRITLESITADVREREHVVYIQVDVFWHRDHHSWFERRYRGDILYRANIEEAPDGAPVLGELELLDYSLSPTSKLQSYIIGFLEVDCMMARHTARIARSLQQHRANRPFVPVRGG